MIELFDFKKLESIRNKKIIFLDLGANVGKVTEKLLEIDNITKIYCFEPVVENFKILERKFGKNDKIKLENKIVWNQKGKVNFSVGSKNCHTNSKITKIINDRNYDKRKYIKQYEIDCIDIYDFIESLNINNEEQYLVIKMDIEGAEYEVLPRMIEKNSIQKVDILLVEFHREPIPGKSKKSIIENIFKNKEKILLYEEHTPGTFKKCDYKK